MRLQGKGIVITGASQGLGKAIAETCVAEGANVFLCARDSNLLEKTRAALASKARPEQRVEASAADVSSPSDVQSLIQKAGVLLPSLDGVVNNAGVYGAIGLTEEVEWSEWIQAIQINLLGTVLLCRAVMPHFRKRAYGKIVNLSGGGATMPLPRFSAYAASKAAVVRFTETLAHEARNTGIDINAIAPGALNTRLLDKVLEAGPEGAGQDFYERSLKQKEDGGVSLEKGAKLCVFLLSPESNGITGRILSAVWDPWEALPKHAKELDASDVYTLRRIVPKDRGLEWEKL